MINLKFLNTEIYILQNQRIFLLLHNVGQKLGYAAGYKDNLNL